MVVWRSAVFLRNFLRVGVFFYHDPCWHLTHILHSGFQKLNIIPDFDVWANISMRGFFLDQTNVTRTNSARLGRSRKIFIGSAVGPLPPRKMDASIA